MKFLDWCHEKCLGIIPTARPPAACASYEATCANGECIDRGAICDGDIDCSDGSDESSCSKYSNYNNTYVDRKILVQERTVCVSQMNTSVPTRSVFWRPGVVMVMMTVVMAVTSQTAAPPPRAPRVGITSGSVPPETSASPGPSSAMERTTVRTWATRPDAVSEAVYLSGLFTK